MRTYIALFRGINVGGNNILPMADLRRELTALGLSGVRTYIQSGNVVFASDATDRTVQRREIAGRIEQQFGFKPEVLLLSGDELQAAVDANPFAEAAADPKTLHFFFLAEMTTTADTKVLDALKAGSERWHLTDCVFYLHAPDGIGRSKLAAKAEKVLGVPVTARNYRTVAKLLEMTQA